MQFPFDISEMSFGIEYDLVQCSIERSIVNLEECIACHLMSRLSFYYLSYDTLQSQSYSPRLAVITAFVF